MNDNSQQRQAFMRLHANLPRQGPGSDKNTADALGRLPQISSPARIYDLGCGPGRASLVLANILQQKIISLDLRDEFLNELREVAARKGLAHLIETQRGDMTILPDEAQTIDLIWSEGAIFCVGFDTALAAWHPLLRDGGFVACSELSWLTNNSSSKAMDFWQQNYEGMRSVAENLMAAENLGYSCFDHFTLPLDCWWEEFYSPWLRHIESLKEDAEQDQFLAAAIANVEMEIDLFRNFHHQYGYEFYLLQKSNIPKKQ